MVRLLEDEGFRLVARPATRRSPAQPKGHRPDVVVTDARMPPTSTNDGVRGALQVRQRFPDAAVSPERWATLSNLIQ